MSPIRRARWRASGAAVCYCLATRPRDSLIRGRPAAERGEAPEPKGRLFAPYRDSHGTLYDSERGRVFNEKSDRQTIGAIVLAGNRPYLATSAGELQVHSIADGKLPARRALAEPVWDNMAVANGRLFVSTRDGQIMSLGKE